MDASKEESTGLTKKKPTESKSAYAVANFEMGGAIKYLHFLPLPDNDAVGMSGKRGISP